MAIAPRRSASSRLALVGLILFGTASLSPPAEAQSLEEHAAWVSVSYALGSVLVGVNGYSLAIEGTCVEVDLGECVAVVDQEDWLLGLNVGGLALGALVIGITTYVVTDPSTYPAQSGDEEAQATSPPVRVVPLLNVGRDGGMLGVRVHF